MGSEETIVNKIIPIDTIIEVANYLEDQKEEYEILFQNDENKNAGLNYGDQVYEYKKSLLKIEYTIRFKDGKEITEQSYDWFISNLQNLSVIERIDMYYFVSYSSNIKEKEKYEYMHLDTWVHFYENRVSIKVDGKNVEEQAYRMHSYIRGIIENNDERYNKTVKNRKLRIQSFCLSIGFVLSYIIYLVLIANKAKLNAQFGNYLNNKMFIIFGQWFISVLLGNILGYPIMMMLYRSILPKTKYSHYSKSSRKSVYVDNLEDFTSHDEVQIGANANNGKNRETIEKIYKITSKIVLVQVALSILFFVIMK